MYLTVSDFDNDGLVIADYIYQVSLIPLHWAVSEGRLSLADVTFLCDQGADIEARDVNGKTPLHKAD